MATATMEPVFVRLVINTFVFELIKLDSLNLKWVYFNLREVYFWNKFWNIQGQG